MVNFLLQQGAGVNAKTKVQFQSYILTIQTQLSLNFEQDIRLQQLSLLVSFTVNEQKTFFFISFLQNGYTPLHQAAQQGNTHIINVLLQHGAKPNTTTVVRQNTAHTFTLFSC